MDPYSGNNQDPQSLHKYLYVHNNPINNIDPSGMMSLSTAITVVGISMAIIGITMIGIGHFSDNSTIRSIGVSLLVAGILLVGCGYAVSIEALSATQGAVGASIIALTEIMYALSQSGMEQAVSRKIAPGGQFRNLILANPEDPIPSHGIVILRDNAKINKNIGKVNWNYDMRPPYQTGDVVFEFTIDSRNMEIDIITRKVIDSSSFPARFEMLTQNEDIQVDAYGNVQEGSAWLLISTKK